MGTLAGIGAALLALVAAGSAMRQPDWFGDLPHDNVVGYVVFTVLAGALYAVAVALVRRHPIRHGLALIFGVTALMRAPTFTTPPLLTTDVFRYVWDGRVQAAGINPYRYVPAAPELAGLRDHGAGWDGIFEHINRAETAPTIYPPVAQALFALLGVTWSSIWGVKFAMLVFDVVAMAAALLLLRAARQPGQWVLIYAWNPLVAWEFGGAGHIDAAALAFSGLALLAAVRRRPAWAGVALAAAILCKLLPAALFPAIWRRWNWRTPLACLALIVAGYAAYSAAGWRVLGYLPGYADEEGVGGHGAFLLRLLAAFSPVPSWADLAYAIIALAVLLALAVWVAFRAPLPADPALRAPTVCRDAVLLGTALMALLSPHYPWYLAALALPCVLAPSWCVLWLTISAPVLYLDEWHDKVIWPSLVFLPFAVLLALDVLRAAPQPAFAAKGS
ncbi:MAG: hypothetical protein NVS2B11_11810 [Acetobacteraceae bacterium]